MIADERERPEGCVTDLTFDAWFAGELRDGARTVAEAHLEHCARCQARRASLGDERAAFIARSPHPVLRHRRVLRRVPWRLAGGALAATAALLVMVRLEHLEHPETQARPAVQLKGTARIGFFIQRDGHAERGSPGQRVAPGDQIRFDYTSDRPMYLAIYSRDTAGTVSVYFPAGEMAQRISEGYGALLPSAVELDEVLGAERVFALFCQTSFRVTGPQRLLVEEGTLRAPPDCRVDTFSWTKGLRVD
jgi:hypothetical protein